jgi:hypothetical protein
MLVRHQDSFYLALIILPSAAGLCMGLQACFSDFSFVILRPAKTAGLRMTSFTRITPDAERQPPRFQLA